MADYSVISDVSRYLLELLREAVCPALLPQTEQVALCPPGSDEAAVLRLYLYGLRDRLEVLPMRRVSAVSEGVREPPLPMALEYVVFVEQGSQRVVDGLTEHRLLGCAAQALHGACGSDVAALHTGAEPDEQSFISFSKLSLRDRQELWTSLSQSMRPAVFFEVSPVLLSGGNRIVPKVRRFSGEVVR